MKKLVTRVTLFSEFFVPLRPKNPKMADQMKKKGRDVTPADYKQLQSEIARLQSELKREKLRADFYEEMVDFGKEVYGIDLKKAGTK